MVSEPPEDEQASRNLRQRPLPAESSSAQQQPLCARRVTRSTSTAEKMFSIPSSTKGKPVKGKSSPEKGRKTVSFENPAPPKKPRISSKAEEGTGVVAMLAELISLNNVILAKNDEYVKAIEKRHDLEMKYTESLVSLREKDRVIAQLKQELKDWKAKQFVDNLLHFESDDEETPDNQFHVPEKTEPTNTCEYRAKFKEKSTHRSFNKHNMPGHNVIVPQQRNLIDCGLYLLQYAENLFKVTFICLLYKEMWSKFQNHS